MDLNFRDCFGREMVAKNLGPSYLMDLEILGLSQGKKNCLVTKKLRCSADLNSLHISRMTLCYILIS